MPLPHRVSGPFDVKVTPEPGEEKHGRTSFGRMKFDKQFHGDLEGTSTGQMMTAMTETKGSGTYVAFERVTARLAGLSGSFALQHMGTMTRGEQSLFVQVVPDSGTGELTGLKGTMKIRIEAGGKHFYDFDYEIVP